MARALRWWMWLVCTAVAASPDSLSCSDRRCSCVHLSGVEYFCQVNGKDVNLDVNATSYYSVNCINKSLSYEQLPRLAGEARALTKVEFKKGCGLPRVPLGDVFKVLGVTEARKLALEDVVRDDDDELRPDLFRGLGSLKTLSLTSNGFSVLPRGLFESLVNLTWLDLSRNRVRLERHSFDTLPQLRTLELKYNRLDRLPSGALGTLPELRELQLGHNEIVELASDTLEVNKRLEVLDLGGNPLRAVPAELLANAPYLITLTISGGRFETLPAGVFAGARRLRRVELSDNALWATAPARLLAELPALEELEVRDAALRELPADLLIGSSALRKLRVSGTHLEVLPAGLLRDQTHLEKLDLSDNRLATLPPSAFETLGALEVLILKNNAIKAIGRDTFSGLVNLESLDASGNGMMHVMEGALDHTSRLHDLDLAHNQLTTRRGWRLPRSLRTLRLHHNQLPELPYEWRRNARALRLLDLAHNRLTELRYEDFSFLRTDPDSEVNLSHNKISTIDLAENEYLEERNETTSASAMVRLADNPFSCDCFLYWFMRALREGDGRVRTTIVSLENATCASPEAMRGNTFADVQLEALQCEVSSSEGCPAACACAVSLHDRALIADCPDVTAVPLLPTLNATLDTVLRLERSNITRLRPGNLPKSLVELDLANGSLTEVQVGALPPRLRKLRLIGNQLQSLPAAAAAHLLAPPRRVWLAGNPLRCDCIGAPLIAAVQQHYAQVADYSALRCQDGASVALVTTGALCPDAAVAAGSVLAVLGLLLGLAAVLFYKYKHHAKVWLFGRGLCLRCIAEDDLDRDKRYDAFVSFSHLDESFVIDQLVPALETGPRPLRLCVHFRDWVPGEPIPAQIASSVHESRRTIVVLSSNYLRSSWGRVEFRVASAEAERERAPRLIVVLLGDVGPLDALEPELRAYLQTNTYIKWGDPWFWDKLRYALPHRRNVSPAPADRSVQRRSKFDDRLELSEPEKPLGNGHGPPTDEATLPSTVNTT